MTIKFCFISGGIFTLYCIASVIQERLLKGTFGEDEDKFTFVLALLLPVFVSNVVYAYFICYVKRTPLESHVPTFYNACISVTYLLGMLTSFMALQWISYPAQVIAKSSKPIPVLIMGVLIGHKSYRPQKYLFVLLIVTGVVMFMYRPEKAAASASSSSSGFGIGELLILMSLLMDGLTNSVQERVMAQFNPRSEVFMLGINKWSILFASIILLYTGELSQFLAFVNKHPSCLLQIFLFCVCSSLGQYFIYMALTEYGTLTCSIITTTRKFFTVLGSVIVFGHVIKARQWFAVVLVFSGLFLDVYYGKGQSKAGQKK